MISNGLLFVSFSELFFPLILLSQGHHIQTIYSTTPKKKVDPPSTPPASTHAGLLQKSAAVGTSVKWSSPGELSMKRQPNLFGSGSLVVLNENGMI